VSRYGLALMRAGPLSCKTREAPSRPGADAVPQSFGPPPSTRRSYVRPESEPGSGVLLVYFFSILRISTHPAFMERRANPRKKILMSGGIEFAGGHINCLISEISISGAAIEITNPEDIPDRFNLVFKADEAHIPCRVVWRQEERIGVAFD
jgi:PilZ domain